MPAKKLERKDQEPKQQQPQHQMKQQKHLWTPIKHDVHDKVCQLLHFALRHQQLQSALNVELNCAMCHSDPPSARRGEGPWTLPASRHHPADGGASILYIQPAELQGSGQLLNLPEWHRRGPIMIHSWVCISASTRNCSRIAACKLAVTKQALLAA